MDNRRRIDVSASACFIVKSPLAGPKLPASWSEGTVNLISFHAIFPLVIDMNSKLICLAGFMVLAVAAAFVGSAQEAAVVANDAILNNTSNLTSNATINESAMEPLVPALIVETNETLPSPVNASQEVADMDNTMPAENETAPAETMISAESTAPMAVSNDAETEVLALGGSNLVTKPERSVYAIGTASSTPGVFSIGKEYLPDQAYNAGMSAETIMDLSALPFYANYM
jgi:hypothetical protein